MDDMVVFDDAVPTPFLPTNEIDDKKSDKKYKTVLYYPAKFSHEDIDGIICQYAWK